MPAPSDPSKATYMFTDDIKFLQKVAIFHPTENKFLALRRSLDDRSRPGKWDLVGGNVAFAEQHNHAILREATEETGLEISDLQPIQVLTSFNEKFQDNIYHLFIGYRAKAAMDNVTLSHEHIEYKWLTKEEFLILDSADFLINLVKLL